MDEIIKTWVENLYETAIEDAYGDISNEHFWELGYDGEDPNPHTENIVRLEEYIVFLKERLGELR